MRLFKTALIALALASSALVGCDDEPARSGVREWRATDHAQPSQPDPSREALQEAPEAPSPEVIARAADALYQTRCASCHGAGGAGDGADAPVAEMPNFTAASWHAGKEDTDIARAIRMGQGLMPAFGGQLNDRGITALVGHIRTLRHEE